MKSKRLPVLLALMLCLVALRWWSLSETSTAAGPVVQAVKRVAASTRSDRRSEPTLVVVRASDLAAGTRDPEEGLSGNAFAVRVPPPPPKLSTPSASPSPQTPKPFVGPPPPPPPEAVAASSLPPLQVIGGWHDERGASVFVAGPRGVMQGRVGDVLLSEYRITQIAQQQVQVTHVPTNRVIPLPVPTGTLPALTAAR